MSVRTKGRPPKSLLEMTPQNLAKNEYPSLTALITTGENGSGKTAQPELRGFSTSPVVRTSGGGLDFDLTCEARRWGDGHAFLAHALKMKLDSFLDEEFHFVS